MKALRLLSAGLIGGMLIFTAGAVALEKSGVNKSETEQTREAVIAVFKAFNDHDLEGIVALYDPDAKYVTPSFPEPRYGLELVRTTYKDHFDNIPGVHDQVTRIVAEGDEAAVEFTATWDQPTEGNPTAKGSLKIAAFLKFRNGLIVEDITYYDQAALLPDLPQSE
jgi:ketosteroid isomerase-like protein